MSKKYVFVRMPENIYKDYKNVKAKMEGDIEKVTGRRIPLTMPKVFRAIISPEFNSNFIEVDLKKLVNLAREKKR
jgi:hypothetical protein